MGARIGIDLGTTNSVAAMVYDNGPHVIPRGEGLLVPSIVKFEDNGIVVGKEADQPGGRAVVQSVKRLMGRTFDEAMKEEATKYFCSRGVSLERRHGKDLVVAIEGESGDVQELWPHEISARILEKVRQDAEAALGTSIEKVVLTVPAYFEDAHRAATLEAARLAGLDVWEPLLDEPTAAALAFGELVGLSAGEPLLVVDWGGGTFDVTVLMNDGRDWVQQGIDGDLSLGGDDLDVALARMILEMKSLPLHLLEDDESRWTLLRTARGTKHRLSESETANFFCTVTHPESFVPVPVAMEIQRSDFERQVESYIARGLEKVRSCLDKAEMSVDGVRKVLLVGGSSRVPLLRRALGELLPNAHLHDEVDPMHAVALGAALHARMGRPEVFALCPYGYAVQMDGKLVEVIPPDLEVPTEPPVVLDPAPQLTYDGQTLYRLKLFRYTRWNKNLKDLSETSCVRVYGRGFPPAKAGSKVGVELWLDENKVLQVRFKPPKGKARSAEVSMSEVGEPALFTELLNLQFEAEALVEANRDNPSSLFSKLREAIDSADQVLEDRDREAGEACLELLKDGIERACEDRTVTSEEDRVAGWLWFYRHQLLPIFMDLFDTDQREEIFKRMRAIGIMMNTGAQPGNLDEGLVRLHESAMEGKSGFIIRAYWKANVRGVPRRLSRKLEELSQNAAGRFLRGEIEPYGRLKRELEELMEEADASLVDWRSVGQIDVVVPDLRMGKGEAS